MNRRRAPQPPRRVQIAALIITAPDNGAFQASVFAAELARRSPAAGAGVEVAGAAWYPAESRGTAGHICPEIRSEDPPPAVAAGADGLRTSHGGLGGPGRRIYCVAQRAVSRMAQGTISRPGKGLWMTQGKVSWMTKENADSDSTDA